MVGNLVNYWLFLMGTAGVAYSVSQAVDKLVGEKVLILAIPWVEMLAEMLVVVLDGWKE